MDQQDITCQHHGIVLIMKGNETLMHSTTWMKLETTTLKEVSDTSVHKVSFHSYEMSILGQSIESESRLLISPGKTEVRMGSD